MPSTPNLDISSGYSGNAPAATDRVNATQLDTDHLAVENWANEELLPSLAQVIRDDDTLVDGIVRSRNLHPEVSLLIASKSGWQPKADVQAASLANINLSAPGATIDGKTLVSSDRFLAKNQTIAAENGIYVWNGAAVAATRATDADTSIELGYAFVSVAMDSGTTQAGTSWVCNQSAADIASIGVTGLSFCQVGANLIGQAMREVTLAATIESARTLLGLSYAQNIADLREKAKPGSVDLKCLVSGYYASNDGGGGLFIWNQSDSNADNGGTIINPTGNAGSGRWNRVINEPDSVFIEWFGGAPSQVNNKSFLDAAITWAVPKGIKKIKFRAGNYYFTTKPANFLDGIVIEGVSSSQTNLIRNYTAGSTSEGFLTWYRSGSNGGGIRNCGVYANTGTSSGTMLMFLTGGQVVGYHFCEDIVVSYFGTGTYYVAVEANGVDNATPGSQGIRDFRVLNSFLFVGSSGAYTLRLINATNHFISGTWTNGTIWVSGGGSALTNSTVGYIDCNSISELLIENCLRIKVYGEYNTLVLQSSANYIDLFAAINTTVTDYGATNVFKNIKQSFLSSLAASGYQKLPGGLILQWGTFAATTSWGNWAFPIPFPNTVFSVQGCAKGAGGGSVNVAIGSISLSQAAVAISTNGDCYMFAVGN